MIVELKVAKVYSPKDEAQLLNELKATGMEVGPLINFGTQKVAFKRLMLSNQSVNGYLFFERHLQLYSESIDDFRQ